MVLIKNPNRKTRKGAIQVEDRQKISLHLRIYNNHIVKYLDILDHGALAELRKESYPEKLVEMYNIYSKGLDELKKINFLEDRSLGKDSC